MNLLLRLIKKIIIGRIIDVCVGRGLPSTQFYRYLLHTLTTTTEYNYYTSLLDCSRQP